MKQKVNENNEIVWELSPQEMAAIYPGIPIKDLPPSLNFGFAVTSLRITIHRSPAEAMDIC